MVSSLPKPRPHPDTPERRLDAALDVIIDYLLRQTNEGVGRNGKRPAPHWADASNRSARVILGPEPPRPHRCP